MSASEIAIAIDNDVLTISTEPESESRPAKDACETEQLAADPAQMQQQVQEEEEQEEQEGWQEGWEQVKAAERAAAAAVASKPEVKVWHKERHATGFSRSFALPTNTKMDNIQAVLDKGVLTVCVPKAPVLPKPEPKRIAVKEIA